MTCVYCKPCLLESTHAARTENFTLSSTIRPVFNRPIEVRSGEVIEHDGFVFADLLLMP